MPYNSEGTLTTDTREVAISETWETQQDWEAYQSITSIEISNGVVQLQLSQAPDSAVAQYNAQQLTGFSDGDSVSSLPDQIGSLNLNGNGTFRPNGINGFQSVEYDGVDDIHEASGTTVNQKFVVYAVIDPDFDDTVGSNQEIVSSQDGTNTRLSWGSGNGNWIMFGGADVISGSTNTNRSLITAVFDGTNSLIREDGTQTGSGDGGANGLSLLSIGYYAGGSNSHFGGDIAFIEVHDGNVSNGLETREQEIANMWGITL